MKTKRHKHNFRLSYICKVNGKLEKTVECCPECKSFQHYFASGTGHTDIKKNSWCESENRKDADDNLG